MEMDEFVYEYETSIPMSLVERDVKTSDRGMPIQNSTKGWMLRVTPSEHTCGTSTGTVRTGKIAGNLRDAHSRSFGFSEDTFTLRI